MSRKSKASVQQLDELLGEASWLLSHAQALADYGRQEEAAQELARAASCAEQAAGLLDVDGQQRESAIQRVSAASCHEKLGQYARAVTLLRAALSTLLPPDYRARVEQQLTCCLAEVRKQRPETSRPGARPSSSALP